MFTNVKIALQDKLFHNTAWMLLSEATAKISRLMAVVVMAACLSPEQFGLASLALVCHELLRIFSRAGSGAAVIACSEEHLPKTAATASMLQWVVCLVLTALQYTLAETIANFYGQPNIAPLLKLMALSYLCYPVVAVKVFMLQRANQIKCFSLFCAITVSIDNLLTVILLIAGFGIYSIAYAKLAAAFAWLLLFGSRKLVSFSPKIHRDLFIPLTVLSVKVFCSEVLRSLRSHVDLLIAARLLSPEMLGIYSFAKNAGVGLTQSVTTAYVAGLYPYICEMQRYGRIIEARRRATRLAAVIASLFILQSVFAPVYVPLLFSSQWALAADLVSVLCITGVFVMLVDTQCAFWRASGRAGQESLYLLYCVAVTTTLLLLVATDEPYHMAGIVLCASFLWVLPPLLRNARSPYLINYYQKVFS